jgi:hypothetical protein
MFNSFRNLTLKSGQVPARFLERAGPEYKSVANPDQLDGDSNLSRQKLDISFHDRIDFLFPASRYGIGW